MNWIKKFRIEYANKILISIKYELSWIELKKLRIEYANKVLISIKYELFTKSNILWKYYVMQKIFTL